MGGDIIIRTVTVGFGRREGLDRRKPSFDVRLVEKRSGVERRSGMDRRAGNFQKGTNIENERRVWSVSFA